jgi:predicted negative regulator of RcsB-dependent stress response
MSDPNPLPAAGPPAVLTAESRIERFLEDNFKTIMYALLLLAVALAGLFAWRAAAARRNLEAAEKFAAASNVEDCDLVIQKYPGSTAAGNALLQKADLLWQQGKKESSIAALQDFLKEHSAHQLRASAAVALGTKQAALGEKDAARSTFEAFLKESPQSELAPAADIHLGDLLWQEGKSEEAKKHYDSLLQKYPGKMAMFNQALEERQQLMDSGLPQKEVDGPPPAPKPAPPAPKITLPPLPTPAPGSPAVPSSATTPPVQVPASETPAAASAPAASAPAPATPAPAAPEAPAKPNP